MSWKTYGDTRIELLTQEQIEAMTGVREFTRRSFASTNETETRRPFSIIENNSDVHINQNYFQIFGREWYMTTRWCEKCGQLHIYPYCNGRVAGNTVDLSIVDYDEQFMCEECQKTWYYCHDCGCVHEWTSGYFIIWLERWRRGRVVCPNCASHYIECDECGTIDHCHSDYPDLCCDCGEERQNRSLDCIHSYGYKPRYKVRKHETEQTSLVRDLNIFGFELEVIGTSYGTDMWNSVSELCDGLFYVKSDGSLSDYGEEVVTHPATLKYWQNSKAIDSLVDTINDYDGEGDESCGLHIHCNRSRVKNKLDIVKINLLLAIHKYYISNLAGRDWDGDGCSHYSKYPSIKDRHGNRVSMDDFLYEINCGRYKAMNNENDNTIEFRMFQSIVSTQFIKQSIEFCDCIIEYSLSHTMGEIMTSTWKDVLEYIHKSKTTYPNLYKGIKGDRLTYVRNSDKKFKGYATAKRNTRRLLCAQ